MGEGSVSSNMHIAEERGHKVEGDFEGDEEDRYSGVLRGTTATTASSTTASTTTSAWKTRPMTTSAITTDKIQKTARKPEDTPTPTATSTTTSKPTITKPQKEIEKPKQPTPAIVPKAVPQPPPPKKNYASVAAAAIAPRNKSKIGISTNSKKVATPAIIIIDKSLSSDVATASETTVASVTPSIEKEKDNELSKSTKDEATTIKDVPKTEITTTQENIK